MAEQKHLKLIVICGPTATGKSDFAVSLAREINGEVISADSRQVYTGMDIGTGKITKKEMRGVPHHLLDIADPKRQIVNVVKFQKLTYKAIKDISKRGKTPILVGGTGFWIDAVAKTKTFPAVGPNKKLRAELAKLNTEEMFQRLKKINPDRAATIDPKNKHRMIRAIEIAEGLSKIPSKTPTPKINLKPIYIGLDLPQEELDKKISLRLDKRLKRGMIGEVRQLHESGVSWKKLESFGLEYKFVALYLQGKLTKEEMREQLYFAIRHYAKRQRTWFKRNKNILWLNPNDFRKNADYVKLIS
jgi:tRNA dimethylallyltransferase